MFYQYKVSKLLDYDLSQWHNMRRSHFLLITQCSGRFHVIMLWCKTSSQHLVVWTMYSLVCPEQISLSISFCQYPQSGWMFNSQTIMKLDSFNAFKGKTLISFHLCTLYISFHFLLLQIKGIKLHLIKHIFTLSLWFSLSAKPFIAPHFTHSILMSSQLSSSVCFSDQQHEFLQMFTQSRKSQVTSKSKHKKSL